MTRAAFDAALRTARDWHQSLPAAREFCDWPDDISWANQGPHLLPAANLISSAPGTATPASDVVLTALQDIAPFADWRHTYTAQEVGQDFLDHYGWFELAGPTGHFHTKQARITVGYWGAGLHYGRHQHAPEELYTVVSGSATFHTDGEKDAPLGPCGTRYHASNQPHAMTTTESPILTLIFWRGDGLADPPRMTA